MALIDEGGRFKTVRTPDEYLWLAEKDFESLSPDEFEVLQLIVNDIAAYGKSPILEMGSGSLYRTPPVNMETFLSDSYFCSKITKELFPSIRTDLVEVFNGRYEQALIGGSIGAGKSTFARLAMLRMVYEASCLNDPFEAYGVSKSDKIAFPCISVTEEQAHELVFDKIKASLEEIPYFNNEFKPIKSTDVGGILFPNGIWIPPGLSTERRTLGINAFGSIIEEANFFKNNRSPSSMKSANPDMAEAIYKSIIRRMQSRFLVKGRLPGMIIMISSKTSVNAFTERRIKEAAGNPNIFIKESAVYDVAPHRYSGKKFRVAIGSEVKPSRILEDSEQDPEAMKVIDVPIEFKESFENDLDSSIREIAGYATVSVTPYISRRDQIYACIDAGRTHPFEPYVWSHDVPGNFLWDKIAKMKRANTNSPGAWEPIHHPNAPRFVSLDLSKSGDATGIAMGCLGPYVSVHRIGKETEMVPSYHVDFVLRIEAATRGEIIQSEIRNLIYQLTAHGFFIKVVSADKFQSVATLQSLRAQGYQTKIVSVDESTGPYDLLKLAIYENRISYYRYNPLIKELRELQKNWKNGKVDHPDPSEVQGASKDVSDALAQVCALLHDVSSRMYSEPPLMSDPIMTDDQGDEQWILEDAIAVSAPESEPMQEDWRTAAQKRLGESQPSKYTDWRQDFQMPFEMG
jgi:hypothetical protein